MTDPTPPGRPQVQWAEVHFVAPALWSDGPAHYRIDCAECPDWHTTARSWPSADEAALAHDAERHGAGLHAWNASRP